MTYKEKVMIIFSIVFFIGMGWLFIYCTKADKCICKFDNIGNYECICEVETSLMIKK